ncbi:hypothetical protein DDE18_11200 [Nocardioides gansuensis]|uniref:Winged helix DNA-binding domain-containing protein n=1 Tax=Nocardioides gansuensis TaxID=2138300 RepID=A0A2T8FBG7_9ACTN|nr:winged helix DNA-binding domain-containing protein [Nocardioides gansuensis]PVG83052.1 hypothetical protein DDE18_11200 [Nocardioides gansuensis]
MRHVPDAERRARLAVRHGLHPAHRLPDPVAVTRAMTVLHATEPSTVHLSVQARADGVTAAAVDAALYDSRAVVKQLAMRRTLFVFSRDLLPAAWGSASARVAEQERRKIAANVVAAGLAGDGEAWLEEAREEVFAVLGDSDGLSAADIREAVPMLDVKVGTSSTSKWGAPIPIAPRVLNWLGARADIVRGANTGHWRISRPAWARMKHWLGEPAVPLPEAEGYAGLARRWLWTFGPGTEADLVWWLGATKGAVRRALADVGAVQVSLDTGGVGWLLADDLEPVADPGRWAALLPVLDPTTMGWRGRGFHLDADDTPHLYDTNGNGGTTAWLDGRIVGAWVQDEVGTVRTLLRRPVDPEGQALLDAEAARLTAWLDGVRITNVYASLLMKSARLP